MMQPGTTMVPPSMAPPQYQKQPPQQPSQPWMPQQPAAAGDNNQQQQAQAAALPTSHAHTKPEDGNRVLWIGDLQDWMEEGYLCDCFDTGGELAGVKLVQDPVPPWESKGYGFIEFTSHAAAERNLQTKNGTPMPKTEQPFRLNWASRKRDDAPEYTIFVGDLAADVTDSMLLETFGANYPSTKGAKVVKDRVTGHTKGYGFVRFGSESEQIRAQTEMNGRFCSTRPMRIGPAAKKQRVGGSTKASYQQTSQGAPSEDDPSSNRTIIVRNLDDNVTDDRLREVFGQFGPLVHVEISEGEHVGFVEFDDRGCAKVAMDILDGTQLATQNIRLSWGRNPSNKQVDPNEWRASSGNNGCTPTASYQQTSQGAPSEDDPSSNRTIFVGNLKANVRVDHLRNVFEQSGQLVHVKIPKGKPFGFVEFADRSCAEEAIDIFNGLELAGQKIRLSWARSPSNTQVDPNKWSSSSGNYGCAPTGYETYGYAPAPTGYETNGCAPAVAGAPQDPYLYFAGYPGFPICTERAILDM